MRTFSEKRREREHEDRQIPVAMRGDSLMLATQNASVETAAVRTQRAERSDLMLWGSR